MTITLDVPALSLVVLVGTSGSGKSTFAARHFAPTEILSSDFFRGLVADDENDQSASAEAFDALRYLAEKRLRAGRLTVIDATNVQPDARKPFLALARAQHCLPVAIVLDVPPRVAHERNRTRPNRAFGEHVVQNQHRQLRRSRSSSVIPSPRPIPTVAASSSSATWSIAVRTSSAFSGS